MFNWLRAQSKGSVELAVERLEAFVRQEGPSRRTAVLIWALWSSSRISDPTFRGSFFYQRGSPAEASSVLEGIEPVRDNAIKLAKHVKKIERRVEKPADEYGSYATVKAVALDLVCATIGLLLRPNLEERVRSVWHTLQSPRVPDNVFKDIVHWFRAEAALLTELGIDDPAAHMEPEDVAPYGLPKLARL